ncbi:hypothetical protein P152DRAFT_292173 [Eremomyces bilateralis CBS 781.70]|uniref:Rhodopsin domain-containing protein n=1 Tax=Eremomyces bilateralis CBS 781.70 TaxID=1392243 RepID=A0A6G1G6T3_9PEZI|nr:uncharacterized protein P152DRAFT_292173 [Eremomyces bilateralis CBS 781.70]KAF1813795.1 hypothetical protein P152DRAFT_292173 [Eremomyces bilateralis CBS 781.70]
MSDDFFNSFDPRATSREDETKIPMIIAAHTSMLAIALILYICRMVSRSRPTFKLSWDDYLITIAVGIVVTTYALTIYSTSLGYGRHIEFLKPADAPLYIKLTWATQILWSWGVTFIKLSVAAMLLRIQRDTLWRVGMGACIVYLIVSAVVTMALQMTECKPMEFYWNKTIKGTCRSRQDVFNAVLGTSITLLLSDVLFALLPLTFIFSLRRPLRDKLVLAFLMSLGLLCTIAGTRKLIYVKEFQKLNEKDTTWSSVEMRVWAFAESYVGIMAACIPCLRAMFESGLKKIGISLTTTSRTGARSDTRGTAPSGRFAHGDFEMISSTAHVSRHNGRHSIDKPGKDWDGTSIPESEEAIVPHHGIVRKTDFTVRTEQRGRW